MDLLEIVEEISYFLKCSICGALCGGKYIIFVITDRYEMAFCYAKKSENSDLSVLTSSRGFHKELILYF